MSSESEATREFFVGYLGPGPSTRRFLLRTALVLIFAAAGMAALVALTQSDPGEGLRPLRPGQDFQGVMIARPYPHLRYVDASGAIRSMLFVSGGKAGIEARNGGGAVAVTGSLREREGTQMIQAPTLRSLSAIEAPWLPRLNALQDQDFGETVMEGEIVDSKCFLGAMRPGRGPTHRACAQMCIKGGVPPMLVVEDQKGRERHVLLASRSEGPVNELVIPFVAEPVRIRGQLIQRAGMLMLFFSPDDLQKL